MNDLVLCKFNCGTKIITEIIVDIFCLILINIIINDNFNFL